MTAQQAAQVTDAIDELISAKLALFREPDDPKAINAARLAYNILFDFLNDETYWEA